ncbi:MAG: hypothetical protein RLZZ624_26 [Cyanobacteriota bacterium]|jgi:hypothetical protein
MPAFPARESNAVHPVPSTVLKWCGDGELSELDRRSIIHRLRASDPSAAQLPLSMDDGSAASSLVGG